MSKNGKSEKPSAFQDFQDTVAQTPLNGFKALAQNLRAGDKILPDGISEAQRDQLANDLRSNAAAVMEVASIVDNRVPVMHGRGRGRGLQWREAGERFPASTEFEKLCGVRNDL